MPRPLFSRNRRKLVTTKSQVESYLRKNFGPKCHIRGNPHAPKKAQRDRAIQRCRDIKARQEEIKRELAANRKVQELVDAARFVYDTEGDTDALEALKGPLVAMETYLDLQTEYAELDSEQRDIRGQRYSYRYRVLKEEAFAQVVLADGDTYDDLLANLKTRKEKQLV